MTMDYTKAKELIPVLDDNITFDDWRQYVDLARTQCAGVFDNKSNVCDTVLDNGLILEKLGVGTQYRTFANSIPMTEDLFTLLCKHQDSPGVRDKLILAAEEYAQSAGQESAA